MKDNKDLLRSLDIQRTGLRRRNINVQDPFFLKYNFQYQHNYTINLKWTGMPPQAAAETPWLMMDTLDLPG